MEMINKKHLDLLIRKSLKEDIGKKDITTHFLFSENKNVKAELICKENGILCGIEVFKKVFLSLSPKFSFKFFSKDGEKVKKNQIVGIIKGPLKELLSGERTALNFLQHLSGIATLTKKFVDIVEGKIKILDTRKTTPTLRSLEKYAVKIGGGNNHRFGLYDMVLIKDNHISTYMKIKRIKKEDAIYQMVKVAKEKAKGKFKVEIEVENLKEAKNAYYAGADIIMFDNAKIKDIKKFNEFLSKNNNKVIIEWSGKVNLKNIKNIKNIPIDWVSIGALTHSAPAMDFSIKVKET